MKDLCQKMEGTANFSIRLQAVRNCREIGEKNQTTITVSVQLKIIDVGCNPVLKVVQQRSRVSPAIPGRVPPPQNFLFISDLKMASFDAFLMVFYVI